MMKYMIIIKEIISIGLTINLEPKTVNNDVEVDMKY